MRIDRFVAMRAGVSAACLMTGTMASAQAATSQAEGAVQATTPAAAPAAQTDQNGVVDIVVTARKRAENLQNVPIAVTAITAEAIKERSIQTFSDVQRQTPSLTITTSNSDRNAVAVSLRGLTQNDVLLTVDPAVGLYVDGVNVTKTNNAELSSLVDVDRVEVLKGPQGTLYGRNTIGGAINISNKLPTDTLEGQVIARLDQYSRVGGAVVLNIPLADGLAFRGVGQYDHRDGFGRDRVSGRYVGGDLNGGNGRAALRWDGVEGIEVILRGDYAKTSTSGLAFQPVALTPNSLAEQAIIRQGGTRAAYLNPPGVGYQDSSFDFFPVSKLKGYGTSGTISVDLSDDIQFKSITAYRHFDRTVTADYDASRFSILHSFVLTTQRVLTEEAQLGGKLFDNRLDWLVGGFYSRETGTDGTRSFNLGGVNPSRNDGSVVNRSVAAFAQVSYAITDTLGVTGGLRYTRDTKSLISRNRIITPAGALVRCNLPTIYLTGPDCVATFKDSFKSTDYLASVDYKPIEGVLIYAKTSSGFKSGGFNLRGGVDPLTFLPFRPETVTAYEIGLKSDFLDRRLRVNLAAYHSLYDDIQRTVIVPGTLTPTLTVVRNAAKGTINGFEAEITAVPVDHLTLTGTLSRVDPKYRNYVTGTGVDLSAQNFPFVAKWTYSLSAGYSLPLAGGPLRGQIDWSHQSRVDEAPDGLFYDAHTIAPYGLMNVRLSKTFDAQRLDIAFYVRNALDKKYSAAVIDTSGSLGTVAKSPGAPRVVGLEVTKNF